MARDRVLIIDDEPGVLRFLTRALQAEALDVDTAASGEEGYRMAKAQPYAVVVLDLLMPGTDGFSVLRRILHHRPDQAVLVLSCLTDTSSKVRCLDMGAVDYLGKPFSLDELLARIRARMRERVLADDYRLSAGSISLDPVRHEVRIDGRTVLLTRRESTLLAELIHHAGTSVSKQRLLSSVWGYDFDPETNVVDVYVRRLRRKLGPEAIATVRGVGYGLDL
ncbi:MAG TPA: response regulator transcription factor [Marmoricola sp.]|nr:response regulator transcription factor [Marmoricola sp.]